MRRKRVKIHNSIQARNNLRRHFASTPVHLVVISPVCFLVMSLSDLDASISKEALTLTGLVELGSTDFVVDLFASVPFVIASLSGLEALTSADALTFIKLGSTDFVVGLFASLPVVI